MKYRSHQLRRIYVLLITYMYELLYSVASELHYIFWTSHIVIPNVKGFMRLYKLSYLMLVKLQMPSNQDNICAFNNIWVITKQWLQFCLKCFELAIRHSEVQWLHQTLQVVLTIIDFFSLIWHEGNKYLHTNPH